MRPTYILSNEHRVIEQVLDWLVKMVSLAVEQRKLEKVPARQAIDFFSNKSQEVVSQPNRPCVQLGRGPDSGPARPGQDNSAVARADTTGTVHTRPVRPVPALAPVRIFANLAGRRFAR